MKEILPARATDPGTSHSAARKAVTRRPIIRDAVHTLLSEEGPMTHDQIIAAFQRRAATVEGWPLASPSGIRTRVNELVRDRIVERVPSEVAKSSMGNAALIWRVVIVQEA